MHEMFEFNPYKLGEDALLCIAHPIKTRINTEEIEHDTKSSLVF